jgi:uncharacterized membrane protein
MGLKVLVVGRAQTVVYTEVQGLSIVPAAKEWNGAKELIRGLTAGGHEVTHLSGTLAPEQFPEDIDTLSRYDVLLLGDIAADTLLLHPEVVYECKPHPNRIHLIRQYVDEGGGFVMTGGWLTFQGIDGKGRWHGTAVEEVLPVNILDRDDRVERPEGARPEVIDKSHRIFDSLPKKWPRFLGYSKIVPKKDSQVLMKVGDDAFLVTGQFGEGKTAAFASSPGPHWGGMGEYLTWKGHDRFWCNLVQWAGRVANS